MQTLERPGSVPVRPQLGPNVEGGLVDPPDLVRGIGDELAREGQARRLQQGNRTMQAAHLCPEQGNTATRGFRDAFRR